MTSATPDAEADRPAGHADLPDGTADRTPGADQAALDPTAAGPTSTATPATDRSATDRPGVPEPVGVVRSDAEPHGAEPHGAEPHGAEPADAAQAGAEPPDAAQAGGESADAEPVAGTEQAGAAPVVARVEPAEPSEAVLTAVELARAVAVEMAGADAIGEYQEVHTEDGYSATHYFAATQPGYRGWRWAVTVADAGDGTPVTVSESALLPGPEALVAPAWVPWQERVRAGDLGVGDLLPTDPDDERLVPGYLASDDPAVEDVVREIGLGRLRVLSRFGREEAGERWLHGDHGPRADMAKAAPGVCGTCGFYLQLAGSLSAAFGVCANEMAPADGAVVHSGYGCGAHSDVEADHGSAGPVAEVVYDDGVDLEIR